MDYPSWQIGDIKVTAVFETELLFSLSFLNQPNSALDPYRDWMRPYITDDDELRMPVQALLVEADGVKIVVDTCIGNARNFGPNMGQFNFLETPFLDHLVACNFAPDNVDYVICTHLHLDHVGWNTMLVDEQWIPTFPNARYVFSAADVDHWSKHESVANPFSVSVEPLLAAGLVDAVEPEHHVCASVSLVSTPGHTPGHVSVKLSSAGEVAYVTGDMLHSPIQFAHPEWRSIADTDPDEAVRSRQWLVREVAGTPTRVIGTHFAAPTVGYVARAGEGHRFSAER